MNYNKLGLALAEKMCMGWEVTTIINDEFGNGVFLFEKDGATTTYVPFEKIDVADTVTIQYNALGEIVKDFSGGA